LYRIKTASYFPGAETPALIAAKAGRGSANGAAFMLIQTPARIPHETINKDGSLFLLPSNISNKPQNTKRHASDEFDFVRIHRT
jgi:hypothetical protein